MIGQIEHFDQQIFLFLNSLHHPALDNLMYILTGKIIWAPLYAAILTYVAVKEKKRFFFFVIFVLLSVLLADRGSVLIKNAVERLRPCHEPGLEGMVHMVKEKCGGMYGFVSSHAANAFNVAFISLLYIKKRWYTISIVIWAIVVGYTRIYCGVHYPGDVLFGSLYGILAGWISYTLYIYFYTKKYVPAEFDGH